MDPADPATAEALLAEADKDKPEEKRRALAAVTPVSDGVADVAIATNEATRSPTTPWRARLRTTASSMWPCPMRKARSRCHHRGGPRSGRGRQRGRGGRRLRGGRAYRGARSRRYHLQPETFALTLTAAVNVKAVQEEKVAGAATVNDTLADEDATYIYSIESQTVTFPKPAAPEPVEPTSPSLATSPRPTSPRPTTSLPLTSRPTSRPLPTSPLPRTRPPRPPSPWIPTPP